MDASGKSILDTLEQLLADGFQVSDVTSNDETMIVTLERGGRVEELEFDRDAAIRYLSGATASAEKIRV